MIIDPSGSKALTVVPSDTVDLAKPSGVTATKYLYAGVTGDVVIITPSGDTVTLKALAAGVFHPMQATRIKATGTTATNLLAIY
jgi:FtsP/CotA-like multicopper oxidase with cupredoxin domain